ncbi:MAG: energy-coupling factor transporter transmembrane component T [Clostridia bacterium]
MTKLDPRVKLLVIVLMTSLAVIFPNVWFIATLSFLSLLICALLGGDLSALFHRYKGFVSLLFAVCAAQVIFRRTGQPLLTIGNFTLIYMDGVVFGVTTALRFFIILCSACIMAAENSKNVMTAMSKMKIPYTFIFMIMIAIRFLPTFRESFSDSLTAIQLRGIDVKKIKNSKKIKLYSSLILPVVATAIVNSQDLAMSAEARGFGASRMRTALNDVKMRAVDYVAMLFFIAIFGLVTAIQFI